ASVKHRVAHNVAAHHDGVERAVDAGEDVTLRDECGMNARLDSGRLGRAVAFDDGELFDAIAEFASNRNVELRDVTNAFDVSVFQSSPETVSERREDRRLVRCVHAADV